MKPGAMALVVVLGLSSVALAVSFELTDVGEDIEALLRIPAPASMVAAEPGQAIILTDEHNKEILAQVEPAGLGGTEVELILIRPVGMGTILHVVGTAKRNKSPCRARPDKNKTVSLGIADKLIASYQLGVREVVGHPGYETACFFHPLVTPSGVAVTDDAPADHLHHRGLFLSFTKVTWSGNGKKLEGNFWQKHGACRIAGGKLHYARGGPVCATLSAGHEFFIRDKVVLTQDVIARSAPLTKHVNVLDLDIRVTAKGGEAELGKNFYNCLQFRGAAGFKKSDLIFTYADGKQHRDVDDHVEDPPYDRWFDMTGLVAGKHVGAAIVIHPTTPKSRLCYARGVKGLNLDFLYDVPMKLAAGQTVRCRYQLYIHDKTVTEARIPAIAGWFNPGFKVKWSDQVRERRPIK